MNRISTRETGGTARRWTALRAAGVGLAGAAAGCLGIVGGGGGRRVEELPTPTLGPADADLVVRGFEDFVCPHCRTYSLEVFPRLRTEYVDAGRIRYEFHDFPIPLNDWSWKTAIAARSVQDRRGVEAFWPFAKGAFERQSVMDVGVIRDLATQVGADPDGVAKDVRNDVYRPVVRADRKRGEDMGVRGTPAVFVGDTPVGNSYDAISTAIDRQL